MTTPTPNTIGTTVSQWGEGPIWWEGCLYYVDIEGHKLIRLDPESGDEATWDVGERIGTVVPTGDPDVVLYAGDSGYVRYHLKTGDRTPLADPEAALRGKNRFNDGKCDPAGRFWAGTISLVKDKGSANLYCLDTDGSFSLKVPGLTNSNGICWTEDAKTMYHIDTPTREVRAYEYDLASGNIGDPRVAVDTATHGYASSPDGMTIDAEGMLWVAFCHGGCVVRFDPQKNKELRRIDLPCIETTACTFGGRNLDRLFVTTGIKRGLDEPQAGQIFVIDGLGIQGRPASAYKG
ncbi:MAG: SMP-30/gluconolactonase/LRE family protein [Verrucomicrobia bacterium]|jgi:sugar lactone lactonase YvrE|nr:SMP-30/gluconolactonase/LRE family protein [Verrucomicrobiota bacterium]